jgi:hypothetical protein
LYSTVGLHEEIRVNEGLTVIRGRNSVCTVGLYEEVRVNDGT